MEGVNRYGEQARNHWQTRFPQRVTDLEDPEAFFTQLGEDIAEAIETLTRQLADPAPAGEGYLQRLRRLNTARTTAESTVIRQMVLLVDEDQEEQSPPT